MFTYFFLFRFIACAGSMKSFQFQKICSDIKLEMFWQMLSLYILHIMWFMWVDGSCSEWKDVWNRVYIFCEQRKIRKRKSRWCENWTLFLYQAYRFVFAASPLASYSNFHQRLQTLLDQLWLVVQTVNAMSTRLAELLKRCINCVRNQKK